MSDTTLDTTTEEFTETLNTLGYKLTMEHIKLQILGPDAIEQVKANMTTLLTDFAVTMHEQGYDKGVESGLSLQKMVGND